MALNDILFSEDFLFESEYNAQQNTDRAYRTGGVTSAVGSDQWRAAKEREFQNSRKGMNPVKRAVTNNKARKAHNSQVADQFNKTREEEEKRDHQAYKATKSEIQRRQKAGSDHNDNVDWARAQEKYAKHLKKQSHHESVELYNGAIELI